LVRAFVFNCRLLPDEIARILLVHQQDSEIESYVARHQNIEDMMAARDIISQSELDLTSY